MTSGIDYLTLLKDYKEGKSYKEIAISQGCCITTVANRVRDLGLKRRRRSGKSRELFSEEEKYLFSKMIETRGGRKQLLEILRGE